MKKHRHPTDENIKLHLDLKQSPAEAESLIAHIDKCSVCNERLWDFMANRDNYVYDDNADEVYGEHRVGIPAGHR